jgi:hypothetical protein
MIKGANMGGLRKLRRRGLGSRYEVEPLRNRDIYAGRKLSEVLLDFAAPFLDIVDDDYFETIVKFAALCWNLSFLPDGERQKELEHIINEIGITDPLFRTNFEDHARMLLRRKQEFFAKDRRFIVNFKIVEEGDDYHLFVMSSPAKDFSALTKDAQKE